MTGEDQTRLGHLTKDEFAAALAEGRWLLLPFGAVEAHGPHLPLSTDLIQAEHVCAAVAARVRGLWAPGLPYGICRTMRNFSGTVSLTPATFQAVVREVVGEYVRHGARKLALYSGHAEPAQLEALREAVLPLVEADPELVVLVIGAYAFIEPIRQAAGLTGRDGHAASLETSAMLAAAEATVRLDRIPALHARPPLSRFRVLAKPEAEFPTGVRGDTSKVSRDLGERALHHVATEFAELLGRVDGGQPG
ncbi:MAG TPA: creatininase family protein [Methylomirabilota bacterium]|jgi:creatinine amidohydrolase|nr:creatininase family protein [Methylomirabilota bacterium]